MSGKLFNVRMEDDLRAACREAADAEQLKESVWAREVLAACSMGGVTLADLRELMDRRKRTARTDGQAPQPSPHPGTRALLIQGRIGRRTDTTTPERNPTTCTHPATAVKHLPFTDVCSLCGTVIRRR